ncbi:hypothetical protein HN747_02250 [archaeon]|jgi:hypothetical protein|nr:hypothetical protein [archaeon]
MKYKILTLFLIIALMGVVSAGCCFDPVRGSCSNNADSSACTGGEYSASQCDSLTECSRGCCILGGAAGFMTEQQCSLTASSQGYPMDFRTISESECGSLSISGTQGACLLDNAFTSECYYIDSSECMGGTFYPNIFCSDSSLGTDCDQIADTVCGDDGNVHYMDNCGNIDTIKESCDYSSGTVCTVRNSVDAYCKDLNCGVVDELQRNNGDRWCYDNPHLDPWENNPFWDEWDAYNFDLMGRMINGSTLVGVGAYGTHTFVDSSHIAKFDTMMKEDIWGGYPGGAGIWYDRATGVQTTFDVNGGLRNGNAIPTSSGTVNSTAWTPDTWEDTAFYWTAAMNKRVTQMIGGGHMGPVYAMYRQTVNQMTKYIWSNVNWGANNYYKNFPVGYNSYSKSCVDGEIIIDTCASYKGEICGNGQCVTNDGDECISTSSNNSQDCDPEYCTLYQPRSATYISEGITYLDEGDLLEDLDLDLCLPKIPQGDDLDCDEGDFSASAIVYNSQRDWFFVRNKNTKDTRNIGIFGTEPAVWVWDYNTYDLTTSIQDRGGTSGSYGRRSPRGASFSEDSVYSPIAKINYYEADVTGLTRMIESNFPDPLLLRILDDRCAALGDCSSSSNIAGDSSRTGSSHSVDCGTYNSATSIMTCTLTYDCKSYVPPSGDANCEQCQTDGLPCTEYKCESLGRGCDFVQPSGINTGHCVRSSDYTAPVVSSKIRKAGDSSWTPDASLISFDYNDKIELEITTNEISQCKFNLGSSSDGSFSSVQNRVDDEYDTTHSLRLLYPGQEQSNDEFYEQEVLGDSGIVELYVYCEDLRSNFNLAPHLIRLNIGSPPDRIPPQIEDDSFSPSHDSYILMNSSIINVGFNLNENAQCKWDTEEKEYSEMNHSFSCVSDSCSGILPTQEDLNRFYIRCADPSGNANAVSKIYTLLKSQEELTIETIFPRELVTTENHFVFDLEATVSGGAGDEICEFKVSGLYDDYIEFSEIIGTRHVHELDLPIGVFTVRVHCTDSSTASDTVSEIIRINQDLNSPLIARAYEQGGSIILKTREEAECRFDYYTCSKSFENMTVISGNGFEHSTSGIPGKIYHIKCSDGLGNVPPSNACSRIIRA